MALDNQFYSQVLLDDNTCKLISKMSKEEREHAKEESEAMDMIFTGYELLLKSDKILGGYSCSLYLPLTPSIYQETIHWKIMKKLYL